MKEPTREAIAIVMPVQAEQELKSFRLQNLDTKR